MNILLKLRNQFFEEIKGEQFVLLERKREKLKKKIFLVFKLLLFFMVFVFIVFFLKWKYDSKATHFVF